MKTSPFIQENKRLAGAFCKRLVDLFGAAEPVVKEFAIKDDSYSIYGGTTTQVEEMTIQVAENTTVHVKVRTELKEEKDEI